MRTHAMHRACLLLTAALLTSSRAFAEADCPEQAPAYKVCFGSYETFVERRLQALEAGLKLDQYVPNHCFLERSGTDQERAIELGVGIERSEIGLEDIAPLLAGRAGAECSSHKEECDPSRDVANVLASEELIFRLHEPTTKECFEARLNRELGRFLPDAGEGSRRLRAIGPFDDDADDERARESDQFKVAFPRELLYALLPSEVKAENKGIVAIGAVDYSPQALAASLNELGVVRIDPFAYAALRNGTTAGVVQSGDRYTKSLFKQNLYGAKEVIGLIDDPLDTGHCFLNDPSGNVPGTQHHRKLLGYRSSLAATPTLHGTFVAGILAGESSKDLAEPNNGQAPKAQITFDSVGSIASHGPIQSVLYDTFRAQSSDGAKIFSNSWGDDERRWYTNWAYDIDRFTREDERSLVLFAVHNDGQVMSPENAKNVLAVGASKQADLHKKLGRAGKGPTCDDRRKPEIFAPGCQIRSAISSHETNCTVGGAPASHSSHHQGTVTSCATSWATPAVAGAAALARQHLKGSDPSGALLKAILLNATRDLEGDEKGKKYPNNIEGWGWLALDDALFFAGDKRKVVMDDVLNRHGFRPVRPADVQKYKIKVTDSDPKEPLKVTLVWTDPPPAKTVRCRPVVNNLDLQVRRLGCAEGASCSFLGNVFSNAGASEGGGDPDTLNNVEQVLINEPAAGEYCVSVIGTEINVDRQGYALVITGAVEKGGNGC